MTALHADTEKRASRAKRGGVWVNDKELIEWLGLPVNEGYRILQQLDRDPRTSGFPQKQKLFCNRRYLPAVQAYFEALYGLKMGPPKGGRP